MVVNSFLRQFVPTKLMLWRAGIRERRRFRDFGRIQRSSEYVLSTYWRNRIDRVLSCPDNARIERVPEAGQVDGYHITMQNGVRVAALGFFGEEFLTLLRENRGVHEPSEEYVFAQVLKSLTKPGVMLELGAYWSYYSLSYLAAHPDSQSIIVEPNLHQLATARYNFQLNQRRGRLLPGWIGATESKPSWFRVPTVTVDGVCLRHGIERLQVLHCDIDGGERDMLKGASRMLSEERIGYVFLGTHSPELHEGCQESLRQYGFKIITQVPLDRAYAGDGFIAARHESVVGPDSIPVALREAGQ